MRDYSRSELNTAIDEWILNEKHRAILQARRMQAIYQQPCLNLRMTAEIPTIPTVPTNVSAFTNDAGYLTVHQDISGKADKTDTDINSSVTTLFADLGWTAS